MYSCEMEIYLSCLFILLRSIMMGYVVYYAFMYSINKSIWFLKLIKFHVWDYIKKY